MPVDGREIAGLGGRRAEPPDVEVVASMPVRLVGEEHGGQAPGVGEELRVALLGGVAVAEQQQVDLVG